MPIDCLCDACKRRHADRFLTARFGRGCNDHRAPGIARIRQILQQGRMQLERNEGIGQTGEYCIGAADHVAGQRQVPANSSTGTGQEVTAADIRKQADLYLGHGHFRAFRNDAHAECPAALGDAHSAAHDDTVHQRDIGFRVVMDQMVQCIFFREKIFQCGAAATRRRMAERMKIADIAASAKCASHAAANDYHVDRVIVAPRGKVGGDCADHLE